MEKFKAFLKRKDIEISAKRYGIDALAAMAQGLFCSLLIGTILNTLGSQFNIGFLLDFYGDVLSERKRNVLDMYYNEDFSLSEISEEIGISRQGVRDLIKKAEEELCFLEAKLGLAKKMTSLAQEVNSLLTLAEEQKVPRSVCDSIEKLKISIEQ